MPLFENIKNVQIEKSKFFVDTISILCSNMLNKCIQYFIPQHLPIILLYVLFGSTVCFFLFSYSISFCLANEKSRIICVSINVLNNSVGIVCREQVEEYSNKVANAMLDNGYKKGDVVGLLMENRPEFVAIWLGMSKVGIVTALINYNLKSVSLVHSVNVANCNILIYGSELSSGAYS